MEGGTEEFCQECAERLLYCAGDSGSFAVRLKKLTEPEMLGKSATSTSIKHIYPDDLINRRKKISESI